MAKTKKSKTTPKTKKASQAQTKPPTKSEVYATIAEKTDLSKRQVGAVFDEMHGVVQKSLKRSGAFTMPGLYKMTVKKKPATKARKGRNPFNGEEIMIKAKPASKTVRIRPLKSLKEMVA